MFLRLGRFRLRGEAGEQAIEILNRHAATIRSAAGCESVWLGQGQHPANEFVIVAIFRDEESLARFESRLRSDPTLSSDFFSLLGITSQPPEAAQYQVLAELSGANRR